MKIEKINENKIKCTLNPADLEERKITIKEIATGSEKAHELLNEMVSEANAKFGFQAEGTPLTIEAACLPDGQVVLLITKAEIPNAPKGRGRYDFSITKTGEPLQADVALKNPPNEEIKTAIDNFFDFAKKQVMNKLQDGAPEEEVKEVALPPFMVYIFKSNDELKKAIKCVKKIFAGNVALYKNPVSESHFLVLYREGADNTNYNKACNLMSEYGLQMKSECISLSYYSEHYDRIYEGEAKGLKL